MTRTKQPEVLARDLMHADVVRLAPDSSIEDAVETLEEHSISGAPVVDAGDRLLGVFSVRDVARREHMREGHVEERSGDDRVPDWGDEDDGFPLEDAISDRDDYSSGTRGTERVVDWMNPALISVELDETLSDVCKLMASERIHRVFVIEEGRLRGVISSLDIVRHVANAK